MFRSLVASAFLVTGCCSATLAAEPTPLTEQDLRSLVPGSAIEIHTPLGTVVPVRFATDGTMTGEAGTLASVLGAERDRGRWWVMSDQLCFKWFRWFDAERRCLKLARDGNNIAWAEQGGDRDTGTATITTMPSPAVAEPVVAKPKAVEVARANVVQPIVAAVPQAAEAPPVPPSAALANLTIISRAEAATPPTASAEPQQDEAQTPVEPPSEAAPKKAAAKKATETKPQAAKLAHAKPYAGSKAEAKKVEAKKAVAANSAAAAKPTAAKAPFADPTYQVAHVEEDDVLNIRSGPSEYHAAVGAIPPSGRGVKIVGACESDWCPVVHGRAKGWVNSYYLAPEAVADKRRATR